MKKIGYLGPKGTFSYEACLKYKEDDYEIVEYNTITDTIINLTSENIDKAIVPIENSIQGCVTDSIDTIIKNENIFVVDELLLDISQNLLSNYKCSLEKIEKVYSHTQAISQCKKFLEENNLYSKIEKVNSTAEAAKLVSNSNEKVACICSKSCIKEYNLNLLKEDIQDNLENQTRFWILSSNDKYKSITNKMSLIFSVKDKPGALLEALEVFNRYNLNLTKIESRPAKTRLGEYYFLIDIEIKDKEHKKAIDELIEKGFFVRILGKY